MAHKGVKGVAMSNFSDKEVENLTNKGNGVNNKQIINIIIGSLG